MGYTSYLGLSTSSSSAGSAITFLQSRLSQFADANSNMTIIDGWASSVSGSLSTLKIGQVISVNATFQSGTLYTANAALITSYSNYQIINLKLNASNGGVTTLQINSLAVITLKKVINGSLTDLSANDILANTYNLFVYDGTYWVLLSAMSSGSSSGTSGSSGVFTSGSVTDGHLVVYSGTTGSLVKDGGPVPTSGSGGTTYTGTAPINVSGSVISHTTSGVSSGSYNLVQVNTFGLITSASYTTVTSGCSYGATSPVSISGSNISLISSGVNAGTYLAANIIVNSQGLITSASNGTSASSVGAPSNSPFITSSSNVNLTNYQILTAGSNITITSASANGGQLIISASSGGGKGLTYSIRSDYTGGDLTLNSLSWVNLSTATDLSISAQSGDMILVGMEANTGTQTVAVNIDVGTLVSGSLVHYLSTKGVSPAGIPSWYVPILTGGYVDVGGTILYSPVSGDLSGGTLTLRLVYQTSLASNKTMYADATNPLVFWAVNLSR